MSTKQELTTSNSSQDAALAWLLITTMAPHRRPLLVALVLLLATSAMNVLPPYLLQQAIDGPIAQGDVAGLWPLAALYGATALAMFGLNYAYTYFLQQAAQGNFGVSTGVLPGRDAFDIFLTRLPATIELSFFAILLAIVFAIPLGYLAARRRNTLPDTGLVIVSLIGVAVPVFFLAFLLKYQFAIENPIFPVSGRQDPNLDHESPLHELFEDQLASADLVILNKADGLDAEALARVRAEVTEELPPAVKVVEDSRGVLPLSVLLGLQAESEAHIDSRPTHHDLEGHEDHDHDEFDSFGVELPEVAEATLLAALTEVVKTHGVLGVKGFAAIGGKPLRLLVQGVGTRFDKHFDRAWKAGETRSTQLVLIGQELDQAAITAQLRAAVA